MAQNKRSSLPGVNQEEVMLLMLANLTPCLTQIPLLSHMFVAEYDQVGQKAAERSCTQITSSSGRHRYRANTTFALAK